MVQIIEEMNTKTRISPIYLIAVIFLILGICWFIAMRFISQSEEIILRMETKTYLLKTELRGIGGNQHVKLLGRLFPFPTPFDNILAEYKTSDLSPVLFTIRKDTLHLFSTGKFTTINLKSNDLVQFHDYQDTSGFRELKASHSYTKSWR
jgi:hypothetical protein